MVRNQAVLAMAVDEIVAVPLAAPRLKVRVIALLKAEKPGPFAYLQGMRQGTLKAISTDPENTEIAQAYRRNERKYCEMLAKAVPGPIDVVLSPPSRMAWQAEPYRRAIAEAHRNAVDLTAAVRRTGNAVAGEGASVEEVLAGLRYQPSGTEGDFRRIVIVHDTFTTGTTAAAVDSLLRQGGLQDECEVIVACPLWLDTFTKGS
jgi:hypothetical protein